MKRILVIAGLLLIPSLSFADRIGSLKSNVQVMLSTQAGGVQDEGVNLVKRSTINFIGSAITCVDNAGNATTDCTVTSGGGGGSSSLAVSQDGVQVSSPTGTINIQSGGGLTVTQSPTGQVNLSLSPSSTYYSPAKAAVTSVSSNYLITSTDTAILADGTSASITVTLPTAVGAAGKIYRVKRQNGGANTVTIATTSAQTIDGATTQVITTQYTSVDLISDGSNWEIL